MTDRELLELAAKAAGLEIEAVGACIYVTGGGYLNYAWNPRTDNGDALWLAVTLQMNILTPTGAGDRAMAIIGAACRPGEIDTYTADVDGDPYAATRRAIVLAAAEIGRNRV